jgi:hypothetical protein
LTVLLHLSTNGSIDLGHRFCDSRRSLEKSPGRAVLDVPAGARQKAVMRVIALLLALLCFASAADRKPNIVFILADDLGYGELGCFGQKQIATPNLDRMAAEGIKFTRFYAGSTVCAPSRSVLMTGRHTGHTRVRGNAGKLNQDAQTLRKEDVTIAEVLKSAGYTTALIGKWGLGYEGSQGVPTKKGFDYFYGYLDQTHAHNPYPPFIMRNEERLLLRNKLKAGSGKDVAEGTGVSEEPLDFVPDLMAEETLSVLSFSFGRSSRRTRTTKEPSSAAARKSRISARTKTRIGRSRTRRMPL